MAREFQPRLAPMSRPYNGPRMRTKLAPLLVLALSNVKPLIALAVAQAFTLAYLPSQWSAVPLGLVVGFAALKAVDFITGPADSSAPIAHVVPGRVTALLPKADGSFGTDPSGQQVVVFNLGVQFNHAMGRLGPGGRDIFERFTAMNKDIMRRRDELGLISMSAWNGQPSQVTRDNVLMTYYFRDVESVHRFAHEEMHREAWNWYNGARVPHIGIYHETYVVPPHAYESVYANCRPVLLGAGTVQDDKGAWRSTLVSADHAALKSQWGRMNRDQDGVSLDYY